MTREELFTLAQVGKLLGIKAVSVRYLAARYNIGEHFGRDWTFTQADIVKLKKRPAPGRPRKGPAADEVEAAKFLLDAEATPSND